MLAGGGGAIVNASSLLGIQAFPYQFAYTASKHAVVGMTRAVASEYAGQGIRCNAIAPVTVQGTSMGNELVEGEAWAQIQALIPAGRAARIDDIVNAVLAPRKRKRKVEDSAITPRFSRAESPSRRKRCGC
jgi:NAD(P)-dependent dehydrogenase (short-subunit alcohol dehydrogenase family)